MIGLEEKEPKVRKVAGLIATHAARTKKQDVKSALHVEDQVEKSVQNTLRVVQPHRHVAKEANGVKNLKEERKDDHKNHQKRT